MMNRMMVADMLKNNIADVVFTKANGEERKMRCTLIDKYIPTPQLDHTSARAVNEQVLPVWDLDKNSWRSFRLDSIKEIQMVFV